MKFQINRLSNREIKPCEEARKEFRPNVDIRRVDSPNKVWTTEKEAQLNWFAEGINHRVENGRIKRDLPDLEYWTIEFKTLEELLSFQEKYREISISEFSDIPGLKLITIKDQ
ncbi:hypothetical protein D3C74_108650 [compost metagenome]